MVNSHVCIIQNRFNLSTRAKLWAMPRKELCLCQGVVSPKMSSSRNCSRLGDTDTLENLWFTDDPALIILLANRRNWTPAKLDHLLGRSHYCRLLLLRGVEWVHDLFLFPPCFRENEVATCKIGSFLCSLDNLLQKNVIVFFFGNQISKWRSFEKRAIFDLLCTFFSYQGKVTKIPSAHISLTYIHVFCSPY